MIVHGRQRPPGRSSQEVDSLDRMSVSLRAGIPPFYVMDVWLAAAERQRTHGDLVNLSAGQPSAGAPAAVRAAAKAALDNTVLGYTVALGIPELRTAIANSYQAPARARRRPRRGGDHHRLVGRIPVGVPGVLRRGRPGGDREPRVSVLPQHPVGARLRGRRDPVRTRDQVPAHRTDARRARSTGAGCDRREPGEPDRHRDSARGAGGDRVVVRRRRGFGWSATRSTTAWSTRAPPTPAAHGRRHGMPLW